MTVSARIGSNLEGRQVVGNHRRSGGGALVPVLLLLVLLMGVGAWNYHRNWSQEKAEEKPRPYKSYSDGDLVRMEEGYRMELAEFNKRFGSQRSRRIAVQNRGLISDQIDEFERVQRAARHTRQLGGEAAGLQSQLDSISEERRLRAERTSGLQLHLKRLLGV
jgi:uncharacterized protein HemX